VETVAPLEEHYGLAQRPFGLTLDQAFVYPSRSYTTALQDVRRALEQREGLVVLTGETGTGKTMLCRTLVGQLGVPAAHTCAVGCEIETPGYVSMVLDPHVTFEDLLLHVLTDFARGTGPSAAASAIIARRPAGSVTASSPTRHQLVRALQQFLVSLIPTGACAVVVIDEAQHLDPVVLEQLRLLLNLETNEAKLLQIVLVGHPDLNRILQQPGMRQLDQRVARRCVLEPLSPPEVKRYIEHRLATAQRLALFMDIDALERGDAVVELAPCNVSFTPSAIRAVATRSHGIPRVVNLLCDRALEIGYERGTHTIDVPIVRAAARRVAVGGTTVPRGRAATYGGRVLRRGPAKAAIAAAALAVIAIALGALSSVGYRRAPALPSSPRAFGALTASIPTVPTKPTEVRPLEVFDSFNVKVASFRSEPQAAALAAQLVADGLPAFVRSNRPQEESGLRPLRPEARALGPFHVTVGPYLSQAEAMEVRELVAGYGHADADVFVEYGSPGTHHADARLLRVVTLHSADRVSLALEMTAEPKRATLRALSDRVLELDAGPVTGSIREEELAPASDIAVIKQVSLRKYSSGDQSVFVRARVRLQGSGRGDLRVAGRTIYVDFASQAPAAPLPTFQEVSAAPRAEPKVAEPKVAGGLHPSTVARGALNGVEGQASGYREAVRPLVARLTEIGPFVLSAAATPADDVLEALGRTLAEVEGPLGALEVPQPSRAAHDLLTSAVAAANRAVAPDFRGDRVAQAHRALALIDAARSRMPLAGSR
jgi:type II secretory pathway predicted ATPase ExeA